jgi:stress response protein YsnF
MSTDKTFETFESMRGDIVYSSEGEKIGVLDKLYVDRETREPEWLGIGTGFLRSKQALVPVLGWQRTEDGLTVPYTKDEVKSSPDIDMEDISVELERSLYEHYGVPYSQDRSDTTLPDASAEAMPSSAGAGDGQDTMTRSEEELHIGTERAASGRVRLHKWVETEPVEETVTLQQETAEVVREPIDRHAAAGEIGEQDVEVELTAERPVVEKKTVAKEKVGIRKGTDTKEEAVGGEVRKEVIEVEGEDVQNV